MNQTELLKEARDLLVMCTLIDKSGQCESLVNKIDQALSKLGIMQAEASDCAQGAAVGQRSVDTATCGVDDNGWHCHLFEQSKLDSPCNAGCVLARSSCEE